MLTEEEIKLRLVEAAAQLPCIRTSMDHKTVVDRTHAIVDVWYNNIVMGKTGKAQPNSAPGKAGHSAKNKSG